MAQAIRNHAATRCTDCGCCNIREVDHEMTCMQCGLVLDAFKLVHTNPGEYSLMNAVEDDAPAARRPRNQSDEEWLKLIQRALGLPDDVMASGEHAFYKHCADTGSTYKGSRRSMVIAAYIFIAQSCMNGGKRTQKEFAAALVLDQGTFLSISNEHRPAGSSTINNSSTCTMADVLPRFVRKLLQLSTDDLRLVFKYSHKLWEQMDKDPAFRIYSPDKLAPAIILVACKIANVDVTMKHICEVYTTSPTTIIGIEREINQLVQRRRVAASAPSSPSKSLPNSPVSSPRKLPARPAPATPTSKLTPSQPGTPVKPVRAPAALVGSP